MAIVFPRALPDDKFVDSNFDIARNVMASRTGESVQTMEFSDARWMLEVATKPIRLSKYDVWHAWYQSMREGAKRFYGFDPRRRRPFAYAKSGLPALRAGGAAFDGTAKLALAVSTGNTITLYDLPAGFILSYGDYLGWVNAGRYALHMVTEPVVASSEGIAAFQVEPRVIIPGALDAVVNLVRPVCLMSILPKSWSGPRNGVIAPISFRAIQDFRNASL